MSLLDICQDAVREIGAFEVPAVIVGSQNPTAVQLLALAKRAINEDARRHDWVALDVEQTFLTVASQQAYDELPADLDEIINITWWDRTNRNPVFGPVTPVEWNALIARDLQTSRSLVFRIRRNATTGNEEILLFPTPGTSGETIAFEYKTNARVKSSVGVLQKTWEADDDVGLLDEDITTLNVKYRLLQSRGLPYAEEFRDYEAALDRARAADGAASVIDMDGPRLRFSNLPDGNFG